ncbi:hypothetical protein FRX31_006321 [Thalictrum thalictroides]|uniref:Uncharacterized protein n=1 Tax=Thalictrum thalictroides TaxID=46969 RepID=A0A7J6X6U4_THATH|nr:hypothetical protein FRX31_006321 [Thalictrum thalictroides]
MSPDLVVDLGEEPLNPVNHLYGQRQRRSRSLRRGLHIYRNPLGFGPRNQLLRNEIARLGNRRGRSRTRTVGKENVEAQAPGPIMNDAPSSSSNEVSKVCETPIMSTECGNFSSRREDLIREMAISLRRSSHEGDLRNLINWVVIPLAQDLGLSSSLGRVGQERLFSELASQDNLVASVPSNTVNAIGKSGEGGAEVEPRVHFVDNVA